MSADELSFVEKQQAEKARIRRERDIKKREIVFVQKIVSDFESEQKVHQQQYRDLEESLTKLNQLAAEEKENKTRLSHLLKLLGETIRCPSCSTVFVPSLLDKTIADIEGEVATLRSSIKKGGNYNQQRSNVAISLNKHRRMVLQTATQSGKSIQRLQQLKTDVERLSAEAIKVTDSDSPFESTRTLISKKEVEVVNLTERTKQLNRDITTSDRMSKVIERFKYHLCNSAIAHVETEVNRLLARQRSPFSVKIEKYKRLRNKEVKQSIHPVIFREGTTQVEYSFLSRGEQGVVNIAFDIALRDVVNAYSGLGLSFYCNDEKLNAIDEVGINAIESSFIAERGLMLLCTHSAPTSIARKEIHIHKKNTVSTVI